MRSILSKITFYALLPFLIFFSSCSSGHSRKIFRVGVDASWTPLNFEQQQPYVNGYIEELLLEIAKYNGIVFEKIPASSDALLDGLYQHRYDAILSSMQPYEFNMAKYAFSENFLSLGQVLITSTTAKIQKIDDLSHKLVGIIVGSKAALVLEKYPIIIRTYPSIPSMLNDLASENIDGAVLERLPAAAYVRDLFSNKLKIVGPPLTEEGLHAVTKKNNDIFLSMFNKSIEKMKKKHTLDALEKKWQLQ